MSDRVLDVGTPDVIAEVSEGVGRVVLNRPDRRNAFSPAMMDGLARALVDFEHSEDVGAVLLTGAGGAFSSGGDVKTFAEANGAGGADGAVDAALIAEQRANQRATAGRIYEMGKPVIGAIPGAMAGAGLGLALACDLRVGCERTVALTAFISVGLSGDFGTAWHLRQLVGPSQARRLMWLSERLDAQRCLDIGLIDQLVPAEDLESESFALAQRLASGPRQAIRDAKTNLRMAEELPLLEAMDFEAEPHLVCGVSEDHRIAIEAFVAKQMPVFGRSARSLRTGEPAGTEVAAPDDRTIRNPQ